jgi:hypothetical protein
MRPVPAGRWGLVWLCTLAILGGTVIGLELFSRARGYVPSVKDDEYAWALARRRAANNDSHTMAVLGSSRMLLAFSASGFRTALPGWHYVQLAQQGSHPLATLRDLAFDPAFRGIALVDVSEGSFDVSNHHSQAPLVATYHRGWRSIGQLAERVLATEVQSRFALLARDGLLTLGSLLRERRWPDPFYTTTFADRTRYANYDMTDVERRRLVQIARLEGYQGEIPDGDLWLASALSHDLYVLLIQSRGGNVVYVRMPTCGERWQMDSAKWPRDIFWDRLAARTHAQMIHFKDSPVLASLECPDTSHIDSKDGPTFTRTVIDILRTRAIVR